MDAQIIALYTKDLSNKEIVEFFASLIRLVTNQFTVEYIQNYSSSQAMSGALSYGISHTEEKGSGRVVKI